MGFLYLLEEALSLVLHTQGDSGRKVSIFCGVVSDIAEKKVCLNMCLILIGYRDGSVRICRHKNIVNGNKERKKNNLLPFLFLFLKFK
jgi:hypothetical protein